MKQKVYRVTLIVVIVAFLSAIFLANANLSFAASSKKKSPAITRTSAVDYTEAQIKQLEGALNITETQKPLWDNLTVVMRENAQEMDEMTKERAENTNPMNAVEHMKFHREITDTHLDQLDKLIPPFEAFYDSLTDQQKNITDILFRTGKHDKHKK